MVTTTWNTSFEATPAGTDAVSGGDDRLRELKEAIRQNLHEGKFIYIDGAGSANTYTATLAPASDTLAEGNVVIFKSAAANTGASTLNVNGLGAKNILKNRDQTLASGDIEDNQVIMVVYDGTSYQMVSQLAHGEGGSVTAHLIPGTANTYTLGNATYEFADVFIGDNAHVQFGSDQDVLIGWNTTRTGLDISATEGAALALYLSADEGDDAGDEWKLNVADGGTITLGNDINSAGTFVTHLTITPNSTVASSTVAFAGNITVAGTINSSGTITGTLATAAQGSVTSLGTLTTLTVDNIIINGTTIGHTGDTDLLTLTSGLLTVAGEISMTTLDIGGTNVTSTAAEINIMDGGTSATGTTLADADRVVVNDAATMKQVAMTDFNTYFEANLNAFSSAMTFSSTVAITGDLTMTGDITSNASGSTSIGGTSAEINALYMKSGGRIWFGNGQEYLLEFNATRDGMVLGSETDADYFQFVWYADQGDDAGDKWQWEIDATGSVMYLQSDINTLNTFVTHVTFTPHATVASSTVAFAGNVTAAGTINSTNAAGPAMLNESATSTNPTLIPNRADVNTGIGWASSDTLSLIANGTEVVQMTQNTVTFNGNATITGDFTMTGDLLSNASGSTTIGSTSAEIAGMYIQDDGYIFFGNDQDIKIGYDESGNNDLRIGANVEGAALNIQYHADQGDDNADHWRFNIADGGVLTWASLISGSFVAHTTLTPHATVASSTMAFAGNITVAGTINSTGTITGTLATAAQTAITSLGTLTALQIDNLNLNGNTLSSTAGTDLLITPLSGQQIVLDGTIVIDAGVVTGATSITSTAFVGTIDGVLGGNTPAAITGTTLTATGAVSLDGGSFIFNDTGADLDFRVESADNDKMIHVDGCKNAIGIGSTALDTVFCYVKDRAHTLAVDASYYGLLVDDAVLTTAGSGTNAYIAQLRIDAPNISIGTASVTYAMGIYIGTASTEATYNWSLWSGAGKWKMTPTGTSKQETQRGGAFEIVYGTINANNTGTVAIGAGVSVGVFTHTADSATLTYTNMASLYITGIPVASTNVTFTNTPYALWVDAGDSRFDGVLVGAGTTGFPYIKMNSQTLPYSFEGDTDTGMARYSTNVLGLYANNDSRVLIGGSDMIINESGNDYNFRVESVDNDYMLFVDGGNNIVSIGGAVYTTTTPLTVTGTVRAVGNAREIITIFDNTSVADAVGGGILFGGYFDGSNLTEFSSIWTEKENSTSGQYGGELKLGTRPHGGGITTAITITTAQNVIFAGGILHFKEASTPTAIADYGAIYAKTDNKLYFQDGAGTEHEVSFA